MFASVFSNEDLEGMNLYSLIKLDQFNKSFHEYTQEFNSSYSYWKDDISVKAAAYLYIKGLQVRVLRAYLMTNSQAGKCDSLLTLHDDAIKNSLWRLATTVKVQKKIVVPLLLRTWVRHPCRCHRTNVLTAVLVKAIIAFITVLDVTEVKVILAVN